MLPFLTRSDDLVTVFVEDNTCEDEVVKLIESASNAYHRVTHDAVCHGQAANRGFPVEGLDSQRMVIHVRQCGSSPNGNRTRILALRGPRPDR